MPFSKRIRSITLNAVTAGPITIGERRLRPASWVVLSLICVALDFWAGPQIQFPLVYLAPVSLAAWYGGWRWGMALAVLFPLVRLMFYISGTWEPPSSLLESSINAGIRIVVFVSFAWLIDRTARHTRELRHLHLLESMLGVCSMCKNVHDSRADIWEPLDTYVAGHSAEFKHGVCPTCALQYRDMFDRR